MNLLKWIFPRWTEVQVVPLEKVEDYAALRKVHKAEGKEVLVDSSLLVHRVVDGEWKAVGRMRPDGRIKYAPKYAPGLWRRRICE